MPDHDWPMFEVVVNEIIDRDERFERRGKKLVRGDTENRWESVDNPVRRIEQGIGKLLQRGHDFMYKCPCTRQQAEEAGESKVTTLRRADSVAMHCSVFHHVDDREGNGVLGDVWVGQCVWCGTIWWEGRA